MNHSLIAPRRRNRRYPPVIPPPLPREALEERIQSLEMENAILRAGFGAEQPKVRHVQLPAVERDSDLVTDTVLALQSLGIKASDAKRRVQATPVTPNETVETILKICLKPAK